MQQLTMFYLEGCPYCNRARQFMEELKEEDPVYGKIPLKMVEESRERNLANSYDYHYVPCYYIGKQKLAEGAIDKKGVRQVLDQALAE